ncbi:hypothetical protein [Halopiger djelfimassiliensis]|uniref:hypothetical protein n=1 Tax=Halopiger djelfimassiliensis TaxID=1293047 RepID=UPI000677D3B9|nr:hypothetical protein [Halopiger djelfimassiliensis]
MDDDTWDDLRAECDALEPGTELVTPVSERHFGIVDTASDRIVIRFADSGTERSLWREQFAVFDAQLSGDGRAMAITDLQPGIEPYATVVTLSGRYTVADDAIVRDPDAAAAGSSPSLVAAAEARTNPERVHDDSLLLAALLDRLEGDVGDLPSLETDPVTDLYVLASDVQRGADRLRRSARDALLERLGPDQQLHGRYGTVRRTTRMRRRPLDEETVLAALDEHGIPREWVLGIDREKLDVVLSVTDLTEDEVYDVSEDVYVQKTGVDEDEKYSRLQGIADRLDDLEDEALREDLAEIEARLEEALAGS